MGTAGKKLEDETISQYFDGELPEDEASEVRAILQSDAGAKQKLDGLTHLRDLIRLAAEDMSEDVDGASLFAGIQAGIAEDEKQGNRGLTSIDGGGGKTGARPRGVESWKVSIPIAVGLAAAAAILFVIWADNQGPDEVYTAERGLTVEIHDDETTMLMVEAPHGTEVEEVDFGDNTGTVFAVEGDAGEPIAVVWIDDEPEEAMR